MRRALAEFIIDDFGTDFAGFCMDKLEVLDYSQSQPLIKDFSITIKKELGSLYCTIIQANVCWQQYMLVSPVRV